MTFASATSLFVIATVVAYISATLCLPFGEAARFIYMPFVWRIVVLGDAADVIQMEKEFGLAGLSRSWNSREINYAYRVVHEKLRYGDADRSVVLSKMQAEPAQSSVLLGFFVLFWLAMLAGRYIPHPNLFAARNVTVLWIAGTGTVVSLLSAAFRQLRLWRKHLVRIRLQIHGSLTRTAQGSA